MQDYLVDSNILLYLLVESHSLHEKTRERFEQLGVDNSRFWLAYSTFFEFWAGLSKGKKIPPAQQELIDYKNRIELAFTFLDDGTIVKTKVDYLVHKYYIQGMQIYDARLAATLLTYGLDGILTNNVKHFKVFEPEIKILAL